MTHRWRLGWRGRSVLVEADRPDTGPFLTRFLAMEAATADDAGSAHVVARRDGSGYRVSVAGQTVHAATLAAARMLLLEAVGHAFVHAGGTTVLHAGAYAVTGGAVACLGAPRAGKSFLAHAAWRQGRTVLGDDRIALAGLSLAAFPKCLKLRLPDGAKAADAVPGVATSALFAARHGDDRRAVLARSLPGFAGYGGTFATRAVVLIERGRGPRSSLGAISMADALGRLVPSGTTGMASPMVLVRALKPYAESGRLPKLAVGDGDAEGALGLLDRL
jgi:hypothetical protein